MVNKKIVFRKFNKIFIKQGLIKTSMNLDMDFSISGEGYVRGAHRDRETRVLNFLIYLNDVGDEEGGSLEYMIIIS